MMVPRFGFIQSKKGVWEVVKISTGPWVQYADHEQVLAVKDQEIQQIREHEFQRGYQEAEEKYQQILEKAVRFAEYYGNAGLDVERLREVHDFLKEHKP